jgi:predicted lipid-binding transport protein (Tim44 family)
VSARGLGATTGWFPPRAYIEREPGRPLGASTKKCHWDLSPHLRAAKIDAEDRWDAEEKNRDVFDIYTIIFLALAVFIFLRLRSVLGQRTGRERPPYDPYSARDAVRSPATDKIVTLPTRPPAEPAAARPVEATPPPSTTDRWKGVAEAGSSVAAGLDAIVTADSAFDVKHFVTGARTAYEMIVTAFAEGDRRQLRSLLSREVFDGFDAAIGDRESRGETAETRFVSIDGSTITAAELRARTAQITIRFVSKLVSATRDRSGNVIEGSAEKVTDVTDVWTFARDVSSRDPNWKVVATESGQ